MTGTANGRRTVPAAATAAMMSALLVVLLAAAGCGSPAAPNVLTNVPPVTSPAAASSVPPGTSSPSPSPSPQPVSSAGPVGPSSSPSTTTSTPSATGSTGVSTDPATAATTAPPNISPAEAADRAAAEKAWLAYESVMDALPGKPSGEWRSTLSKYAVEPILTAALKDLTSFVAAGKGNYGQVVHHPYWQVPIGGKTVANMGDCVDSSHAGSMDVKTGKKLTVGVPHQNTTVTLVRESDGWKVSDVTYLPNLACPGQGQSANQEASSLAAARSSTAGSSS